MYFFNKEIKKFNRLLKGTSQHQVEIIVAIETCNRSLLKWKQQVRDFILVGGIYSQLFGEVIGTGAR
ncbi:hypothetical protein CI593_18295 [Fischerella thermalis CCMEE 5194]|nr:hypothetical protein CI593_18295 [Fischerella thermalis CCMEE 5194]